MLLIQLVLIIIKYLSGNIYLRIIRPHLHGLESKLFSFAAIAIQSIKNRLLWRQECGNFSTAWRTYLPGNFGGRINTLSKIFRNVISESGAAQADLLQASLPRGERPLLLKTKAA